MIGIHRWRAAALLGLAAACSGASPAPPAPGPTSVEAIADEYYHEYLETFPFTAFLSGASDTDLGRLNRNGLADLAAWQRREDTWRARLQPMSPASLTGGVRVTYEILRNALEGAVARRVCRDELWRASQLAGPQQIPANIARTQPVGSDELRTQALERFRAYGPYVDTEIANLREGVRRGYLAPKIAVTGAIEQLDGVLGTPVEQSPLLAPADRDSTPGFREALVEVVRGSVYPALSRYREYLRSEYLARAREATAVSSLPQGAECYRARLRYFTTLELDPEQVHRTGLEQMERIEAEAAPLAERLFGTRDMAKAWSAARDDPRSRFASREEVVDSAGAALARARAAMPRWFGRLPEAEMIVDPCLPHEEKAACPNSYQPPADDGSRPGRWRINTNLAYASRVQLEAIAFHEGIPGHHLQGALVQEQPAAHPVTRILWNAGYGEGWGLYAERVANDMGLYSGDLAQLGRLSLSALRAARMVVDPGLHVLGWSRERAIDYMVAHTAMSREGATSEVDRYIINPGQATAYMTGQLEIERLRAEAQRRLGSRFDVRAFHDAVLANGTVPLPYLRASIAEWIAGFPER